MIHREPLPMERVIMPSWNAKPKEYSAAAVMFQVAATSLADVPTRQWAKEVNIRGIGGSNPSQPSSATSTMQSIHQFRRLL